MEDDLFLKKMRGVKPFKKDEQSNTTKNKLKVKKIITKNKTPKTTNKPAETKQVIRSDFKISFGDINKDLKRGKVKIDRRLDLHGYSLLDAYDKFKREVIKTYNNNKRCLLVITGKGVYKKIEKEEDVPPKLFYGKIKNSIINWINEDDLKKYVLTYQDAGIEDGGDGAIFIYLRKKKTLNFF